MMYRNASKYISLVAPNKMKLPNNKPKYVRVFKMMIITNDYFSDVNHQLQTKKLFTTLFFFWINKTTSSINRIISIKAINKSKNAFCKI